MWGHERSIILGDQRTTIGGDGHRHGRREEERRCSPLVTRQLTSQTSHTPILRRFHSDLHDPTYQMDYSTVIPADGCSQYSG